MQKELLVIHKEKQGETQGETFVKFWRFESFRAPDNDYSLVLENAERAYLLEEFLNAPLED
jgi:hypothetical protein